MNTTGIKPKRPRFWRYNHYYNTHLRGKHEYENKQITSNQEKTESRASGTASNITDRNDKAAQRVRPRGCGHERNARASKRV